MLLQVMMMVMHWRLHLIGVCSQRPIVHQVHAVSRELQVGEDAPACWSHAQGVPVDPGEPGREVGRIPLGAPFSAQVASQAALNVRQRLHAGVGVAQDFPQKGNVRYGQSKRVDLG